MNIFGDKIVLRAIEKKDCELLLLIINDPETEYMLGGWSFPISIRDQNHWFDTLEPTLKTLRCIIETKDNFEAIGVIMLTDIDYKNGNAEIHIKLLKGDFRGKGFGTDAIRTMLKYVFEELRLHCIYSRVNSYNNPSKRLFEKCGFTLEGELKHRFFKRGKYIDVLSYSIVDGDG